MKEKERQLIAILRGIKPAEAAGIGKALVDAGISRIEVPLNSPEPFKSIEILSKSLEGIAEIGT